MEMDVGTIGWLHRYARRHFWRLPSWYDYDDLIQDGYLNWLRITQRYTDVTERKHMMRLFQICFVNHVNNLSNWKTKTPEVAVPDISLLIDQSSGNELRIYFLDILI